MIDLRHAHAVVTGASRGLGPVIAEALASRGATLTLAARSAADLEATRERLQQQGATAIAVVADVADATHRLRLVDEARTALGPIDVLVNNAGLEGWGPLSDVDPAEIEQVIAVNLTAPLLLTQLVLPEMRQRRRGHIVNISSIAGKSGGPSSATYCATKGGLIRATESLRAELVGTGVSVSAVCPGFVREHGMYARHRDEADAPSSRWIGETTTAKVAAAVLKAIDRDAPELIVSPGPFRLLTALTELAPGLRTPLTNRLVGEQVRRMIRYRDASAARRASS